MNAEHQRNEGHFALLDPVLPEIDHVLVGDEDKECKQGLATAHTARVDLGQGKAHEHKIEGGQTYTKAPTQLPQVIQARGLDQVPSGGGAGYGWVFGESVVINAGGVLAEFGELEAVVVVGDFELLAVAQHFALCVPW